MVCLDERGVSDVVVISIMFIFLVISTALILGFQSTSLNSVADRQNELKVSYLSKTLERAEVTPGVSALEAAGEQLVLDEPTAGDNYLRSWMKETLDFLRSSGYGVELKLTHDNDFWRIIYPKDSKEGDNFLLKRTISITKSGGSVLSVDVRVRMFKILD